MIEGGALAGIFTERDLVRLVAAGARLDDDLVGQHATRDVATVPPDTPVDDAAAMMNRLRIRHLPVADGVTPVGMLSLRDFFVLSGAILRAQGADCRCRASCARCSAQLPAGSSPMTGHAR